MSARIIAFPASRRSSDAPGGGPDAALVYAVDRYLELVARLNRGLGGPEHRMARLQRLVEAWEDQVLEAEAQTVAGVHAKARYALATGSSGHRRMAEWLIAGAVPAAGLERLDHADNMLWEIIQATARLAQRAAG